MSTYLYEDFLENKQSYLALRAFWIGRLKHLMPPEEKFSPYASDQFADGTYFFDGNPIASVVSWKNKKAVRIVQVSPPEFEQYYVSWDAEAYIKKINKAVPVLINEKVIALTLTRETLHRATAEIFNWLRNE